MPSFSPLVKSLFDNPYLPGRALTSRPTHQYAYTSTSNHIGALNTLRHTATSPSPMTKTSQPDALRTHSSSPIPKANANSTSSGHPARSHETNRQPHNHTHTHLLSPLRYRRAPSPTNTALYPSSGILKRRTSPCRRRKGHAEHDLWRHRVELVGTIIAAEEWSVGRKMKRIEQLDRLSWEGEVLEGPPPPPPPPPPLSSSVEGCEGAGEVEEGEVRDVGGEVERWLGRGRGSGLRFQIRIGEDEEEAREFGKMMERALSAETDKEREREKTGWVMTPECVEVVDRVWKMVREI